MSWRDAVAGGLVAGGLISALAGEMAVPRVAAQPGPGQTRTVLVVSKIPSQETSVQQFATLAEAVEAAGATTDALILVDPGEYTLAGPITRPMELRARSLGMGPLSPIDWGNCPGQEVTATPPSVTIKGAGVEPAIRLALANAEGRVVAAGIGLTSAGEGPAAAVTSGELVVRDGAVSGRVVASGGAGKVSLSNVRVQPGAARMTATLSPPLDCGAGAYGLTFTGNDCDLALVSVTNGAQYRGRNVELKDHGGIGLCVDGATAVLCGGSIHDIDPVSSQGYGRGVNVLRGGRLQAHQVHIYDVYEAGVAATGVNTEVTLDRGTLIERVENSSEAQLGVGASGQCRASLKVEDVSLQGCNGPGLYLSKGAAASVSRTRISENKGAGVAVYGGTLSMAQSTVEKTQSHAGEGMGLGVYIDNSVFGPSTASLAGCTVQDNLIAGVWMEGNGGSLSVSGTTLARHSVYTRAHLTMHGNGVFARGVCSGLSLSGNTYTGNASAHVFLSGSNASLSGSTYVTNGALDFTQENCDEACVTTLTEADLAPDGLSPTTHVISLCPRYDTVTLAPQFAFGLVDVEIKSN